MIGIVLHNLLTFREVGGIILKTKFVEVSAMRYVPTSLARELSLESVVSIHYFEYIPRFSYPGESRDFWELIYCDRGTLEIFDGKTWRAMPHGQGYLHPPGQFHNVRPAGEEAANSIIVSFHSETDTLRRIADRILFFDQYAMGALFSILREAKASFRNDLGQAYDAQLVRKDRADCFGSEQVIQNYIELLLIHLIRKQDSADHLLNLPGEGRKNPLFDRIDIYMKENFHRKMTFGEICEYFSVSATTLKNLFRSMRGCGAMEYLTELRIERAKSLLLSGKHSCTDIAELCGFCSVHHFSKVFKDTVRMSPTEYVKSVKAMLEENGRQTGE